MDLTQKQHLIEELMQRLGTDEAFERVAARASIPSLALPGYGLERRYEQQIERLYEQSPSSLASYLEAAALEAGGGFELRFSLHTPQSSGWDTSTMRTAMIRMPSPELLDAMTSSTEEATRVAPKPSTAAAPVMPPVIPKEAEQLEALQKNYARKAAAVSAAPFSDFDKSMQIPSLALRLKQAGQQAGGEVDLEVAVASHVKGEASGALRLKEARLIAGAGPGGVGSVLRLLGEGFREPLMLELEGLVGRRIVERIKPTEAAALITERNWAELMPRRVRVVHRSEFSAWVDVKAGSRTEASGSWPILRSDSAYVPAGEYRLPGEVGIRRLTAGVQLGLTPVTNREFMAFVKQTGYTPENPEEFLKHARTDSPDETFWSQPVIFVSHADASAYCASVGGTLPSAEAWERAAMGMGQRLYPWGDTFEITRTNTREGRYGWLTSVAEFIAGRGPYGHIDLAGNVWEWTSSPATDPQHFVLKGGAWVNDKRSASNGFRAAHRPELRTFYIGFRVAWPMPKGWTSGG